MDPANEQALIDLEILIAEASRSQAAGAGALSAAEVFRLFHAACSLRVNGRLIRGDRNIFAEANAIMCDWDAWPMPNIDAATWTTVLDYQLDEIMHAILLRDDFLKEGFPVIGAFFETLSRIIGVFHRYSHERGGGRDLVVVQRVAARSTDISEHIWKHRESLAGLWTPSIWPDPDTSRGAYILPLVCAYQHCVVQAGTPPEFSSLKLFLYLWVSCPDQWHPSTMDLAFEFHGRIICEGSEDLIAAYIQEAIMDTFGPDLFFQRVLHDLKQERISGRYRGSLIQALDVPGLHPLMLPYFPKYPCLDAVAASLEQYGHDPDPETRILVCRNTSYLVRNCIERCVLRHDLVDSIVNVEGSLLLAALTREIHLVVDDCSEFERQNRERLYHQIQMYTRTMKTKDRRSHVRTFVTQVKTNARTDWWPNLARLQASHYRAKNDRLLNLLLTGWSAFGQACGLEEEKERRRHRREGRTFCSWPACEYSMAKPSVKLSLCQACGEAQYCGRECQKKDWNQGGHKKRCGNRLKAV
ncbi:unnamed protein product [Peniophora sp. CBMAI 1063]|nr:unnamed protein product [Peniophora sp. CBMAI 1063]